MIKRDPIQEQAFLELTQQFGQPLSEMQLLTSSKDFIYVSDPDTYELLYLSTKDPAAIHASFSDYEGRKCYDVLQGLEAPCPFCTNHLLSKDRFFTWRHRNALIEREYLLKDTLIDWMGKDARMEVVMDISDPDRTVDILLESLESRELLLDCVQAMSHQNSLEQSLCQVMERAVRFFGASFGRITILGEGGIETGWPRQRIDDHVADFGVIDPQALDQWSKIFRRVRQVFITRDDMDRFPPSIKDQWDQLDIHSAAYIPIQLEGELVGGLSIFGVSIHLTELSILSSFAQSIAHRVSAEMVREKLDRLQYYDTLVDGYNFAGFRRRAEELIAQQPDQRYALVNCDISYFKVINERFGFDMGDQVLCHMARCIQQQQSAEETFGRITADNLCLLWRCPSEKALCARFDRLGRAVAAFQGLRQTDFEPDLVAGVALLDGSEDQINTAVDRSGNARKSMKQNRVSGVTFFSEELEADLRRVRAVTKHLRDALRNEEIEVYFQPQYRYPAGELVGAEALARWDSPQLGRIAPDEFIPILERSGRIYELDQYIWDHTCRHLKQWKDELGIEQLPPVSVNLSRMDIHSDDLCQVLLDTLARYELPVSALKLEITETAYMETPERLLSVVKQLRELGFLVAIDDFGKGYSSLNTLNNVPVDILKLDMDLVNSHENVQRSGNILASIVRMARWLEVSVIAEGVETLEQADFLKKVGCTLMQGYLFSRPKPADEFAQILREGSVCHKGLHQPTRTIQEVEDYLAPHAQASLRFDVIGPAAMVEYAGGNVEALMINDRFYETLGLTPEVFAPWVTHMQHWLPEDGRMAFLAALDRLCAGEKNQGSVYLRTKLGEDGDRDLWIGCTLRMLASADESWIFLLMVEDVTERMYTSPRVLAADVFHMLYSSELDAAGLERALEHIGRQLDVSRVYIFENSEDDTRFSNTFEWCSEGVSSQKELLQDLVIKEVGDYYEDHFAQGELFYCGDIQTLHPQQRALLERQGVCSVLQYAIKKDGVSKGLVGFDHYSKRDAWTELDVDVLMRVSQILALFLQLLRKLEQNDRFLTMLQQAQEKDLQLEGMLGLTADGAAKVACTPEGHVIRFATVGLLRLMGMEGQSCEGLRLLDLVHREDIDYMTDQLERAVQLRRPFTLQYRLLDVSGAPHWVRATGIFIQSEQEGDGTEFYLVYRDIAQEMMIEDLQEHMKRERILLGHEDLFRILATVPSSVTFDYDCTSDSISFYTNDPEQGMQAGQIQRYLERAIEDSTRVPAQSVEAVREMLRSAGQTSTTGTLDCPLTILSPQPRDSRIFYTSVTDEDGQVSRVVGRVEDLGHAPPGDEARCRGEAEAVR